MRREAQYFRTWIEIDSNALYNNVRVMTKRLAPRTRFMAVIKSNAYGHGLTQIAQLLALRSSLFASRYPLWFGVDSIVEALRLRKEGITQPLFVLGFTLPARLKEAVGADITLSISSFESLKALSALKQRPQFHIKIDTGMHRQGFELKDILQLIKALKKAKLAPAGVYTHFASAKDPGYPSFTNGQFRTFLKAAALLKKAGFKNLIRHAAASGGTLLFPDTHLDMVRPGMALYGYFPSSEAETHLAHRMHLRPVLSWKAVVGEVKLIKKGEYIGYDLTERFPQDTRIGIIPVGYWHGFDRGLSSVGEVLVGGRRRRVLGRVSMDMIAVDLSGGGVARQGDEVVLLGKQDKEEVTASEMAMRIATSPYEIITRINPLIHKVISD
jgi:alanine racemase